VPLPETIQEARERPDEAMGQGARAFPKRTLLERTAVEGRMWLVIGAILLVAGGITFSRYLTAGELAGGCCGGGLLVVAGTVLLVIGVRDRGEFSR
jgi:hypothetical protein